MFFQTGVHVHVFRLTGRTFLCRRFCKDTKATTTGKHSKEVKKEDDAKSKDTTKIAVKEKLLSLLTDMKSIDVKMTGTLAKPLPRRVRKKDPPPISESEAKGVSEEILSAIKSVASSATVDGEKIEQELVDSIHTMSHIDEQPDELDEGDTNSSTSVINELEEQSAHMMASIKEVADSVQAPPGSMDNEIEPQSELTKKLLAMSSQFKPIPRAGTASIENLFHGMKVESDNLEAGKSQFRSTEKWQQRRDDRFTQRDSHRTSTSQAANLFSSPPLNVFKIEKTAFAQESGKKDVFWKQLEDKSLQSLVQFAPANAFEEMIRWTEQGRHWKFPIDNQCEMGAEEEVGFHEHVFLEPHLKGFPKKGPIRHFMDLVCIGLSKNPYISVERKIENIEWFRQYFHEKRDILEEYKVLDDK